MDARAPHLDSLNMSSKHPCWTAHIGFETLLVYNAVYLPLSTVDRRPPSLPSIPPSTSFSSTSFSSFFFSFSLCQCYHYNYIVYRLHYTATQLPASFSLTFFNFSFFLNLLQSRCFHTRCMYKEVTQFYRQNSIFQIVGKKYFASFT